MPKYFKDQKFMLTYIHSENGIFIGDPQDLIVNSKTNESLVIAARGDEVVPGCTLLNELQSDETLSKYDCYRHKASIHPDDDWSEKNLQFVDKKKTSPYDWYSHLESVPQDEWSERFEGDREFIEWAERLVSRGKSKAVKFLLVLAYDDGDMAPDKVRTSEIAFIKVKRGGSELVSEFLLSNFIRGTTINWHRRDSQPIGEEESNSICFMFDEIDPAIYEQRWNYDFTLAGDFGNLALTELIDMDEDYGPEYSNPVFQYQINQKAVSYLDSLVDIPYRVEKILSDEQKKTLADEVPMIVKNELDYIAIKLFGQAVQNFKEDSARDYGRMRESAWAVDMYDFCGGDGVSNAYLGGGLSITPDGQITDD